MTDSDLKNIGNVTRVGQGPADLPSKPQQPHQPHQPQQPRIGLSEALRNNWFEVWYQPKIDLRRKSLVGAEALARIRHPQHGVLLPGNYLADVDTKSLAELAQHSVLASLFDWALFEEAGFNLHLSISVPMGALSMLPLARLIAQYRPDSPRWPGLILELNADQIARVAMHGKEIANHVRVAGITVAIDDFGGGSASLKILRDLPFAELKIDRTLVSGCGSEAANAAICQTAIDLAHRFGSVAVAEGVEQPADLQALVAMGCDFGQGGLIGPPIPKARFLELLRRRMSGRPTAIPQPAGRVA